MEILIWCDLGNEFPHYQNYIILKKIFISNVIIAQKNYEKVRKEKSAVYYTTRNLRIFFLIFEL